MWLDLVSTTMVKRTRFDPLHDAVIEQHVFESIPVLALEAANAGSVTASITRGADSFEVELTRDQFAQAAQPIYRAIVSLLHQLRPAGVPVAIVMPQLAAQLPGLREQMEQFVGCELIAIPDGFAAAATSLLGLPAPSADDTAVALLRRVPLMLPDDMASAMQAPPRAADNTPSHARDASGNTPAVTQTHASTLPGADGSGDEAAALAISRTPLGQRRMSGPAPSHVLWEGRAYPLQPDTLVVGREPTTNPRHITLPDGLAGVSRRHCTFVHDGDELVLLDHSTFGTFVNGERVQERVRVYAGDRVRLGEPGVELTLIAVGRASNPDYGTTPSHRRSVHTLVPRLHLLRIRCGHSVLHDRQRPGRRARHRAALTNCKPRSTGSKSRSGRLTQSRGAAQSDRQDGERNRQRRSANRSLAATLEAQREQVSTYSRDQRRQARAHREAEGRHPLAARKANAGSKRAAWTEHRPGQQVSSFRETGGDRRYITGIRTHGQAHSHPAGRVRQHAARGPGKHPASAQRRRRHKRAAAKWRRAVDTVNWLTTQIPPSSQYQIYTFNTQAQPLLPDLAGKWIGAGDAPALARELAIYTRSCPADGTSLYNAFAATKTLVAPDQIVLITDGLPTQGKTAGLRKYVDSAARMRLFDEAVGQLPEQVPVDSILLPMQGDLQAAHRFWNLARLTNGTLLMPSKDWP